MITPEQFIIKILIQDYEGVQKAIDDGFDVNTQIPDREPIVTTAQASEDYKMLHILWKAGANPTTPWLVEVFEKFERHIIPVKDEKRYCENITRFDSDNFSIKKLNISYGELLFQGNESNIELFIDPFIFDDELVETSIHIIDVCLPSIISEIENKKIVLPQYPDEGYIDSSIYLRNVHNPINVKQIEFKDYDKKDNSIQVLLDLDFEFETISLKNEELQVNTVLSIK